MYTMTFWEVLKISFFDQKQTLTAILLKSFSEKFHKLEGKINVLSLSLICKIQWEISVLDSHFNKVAGLQPTNLLKKRLQHKCFPVNFSELIKTAFFGTPPGGYFCFAATQLAIKCSKLTIEILEQGVKYVQS